MTLPEETLRWRGPVVWWQPVAGWRHALSPELRPRPGQRRTTLCGEDVELIDPTEVDWLMPTCDTCMSLACDRMEQRRLNEDEQARRRAAIRRLTGESE
ncbi:hypothetical protein J2S53_004147 [Actinopolyspora lacussalsi]|nr:hypothetical protein [Actinopolyspora lacussalsi]